MALTEIEFELPAEQFELISFPNLQQGQFMTVQLETDVVSPDWALPSWYAVQKEHVEPRFVHVGPSQYAFAGQISDANIMDIEGGASALLIVQCGDIPLRVLCAPKEDGQLPYGTWETRHISGLSRISAIIEDDYMSPVGEQVDVTIWSFRRLVLRPGDAQFGRWHESTELVPTPYRHDRVLVTARVHRKPIYA